MNTATPAIFSRDNRDSRDTLPANAATCPGTAETFRDSRDNVEPLPVLPIPDNAPSMPTTCGKLGKPSRTWSYRDAEGRLLFYVCRFEQPEGRKEFRPLSLWMDAGALRWQWKGVPEPRPLYRLDLLAAQPDAPVIVHEGEKAADAAADLLPGFVSVTSPNGAQSPDKADWQALTGRTVFIWPDADQPGEVYAREVARLAYAAGARRVSTMNLALLAQQRTPPGDELPQGYDAADCLAEGVDAGRLRAMLATAEAWLDVEVQPDEPPTSRHRVNDNGKPDGPVAHFELSFGGKGRRPGVYWIGTAPDKETGEAVEVEPAWICSPLIVHATTRNSASIDWGRLLIFNDRDGVEHRWAMPMSMLAGDCAELRAELLRQGLEIASQQAQRRRLHDYIQGEKPELKARCVSRTGWHDGAFVLPARTLGDNPDEPTIYQTTAPDGIALSCAGTLDGWRLEVAAPCAGNSRLVLSLSAAFAASCIGLLNMEGGGVHLRGPSSAGKSTAQNVAASVFGPPSYLRTWRQTDNGLEGVASLHSDLMLILDELGQLEPKDAGKIAYMLANGQGKGRSTRDGSPRAVATWRLLFLSSGEISLGDLVTQSGGKIRAGQEVRVIDLPADAGAGMGLLEHVPDGLTPGAFADHLKQAAATHYGHALTAFVTELVKDRERLTQYLREGRDTLASELCAGIEDGQIRRVAQRFAIVAAAGELATAFGLTGWEPEEAERAAKQCFADWLKARGHKGNAEPTAMLKQVRAFLEAHGESRFTRWDATDDSSRTVNRAGFRQTTDEGPEYFVEVEVFKREVCAGFDAGAVARVLIEHGALKPESDKCATRKERLPDSRHTRVYRITPKLWEVEA